MSIISKNNDRFLLSTVYPLVNIDSMKPWDSSYVLKSVLTSQILLSITSMFPIEKIPSLSSFRFLIIVFTSSSRSCPFINLLDFSTPRTSINSFACSMRWLLFEIKD
jgi:hypothetical protein